MLDEVMTRNPLEDLRADPGTAGMSTSGVDISSTQTAAKVLTEDVGFGRGRVDALLQDYASLHRETWAYEWRRRTAARSRSSVKEMLAELSDLGFAWRDVARLLGVSVPAVQKWRKGEGHSGETRSKIATLLAACDLIAEHYGVQGIASWFETPVLAGVPITPMDLYVTSAQRDLVFEHASGHVDPEQILMSFDPDWREHYRSDFEVFRSGDGELSIRAKER